MLCTNLTCFRQPFEGQERYNALKSSLVEQSIRLATIAQRDMFAENQATVILRICQNLAMISDKIIQVSHISTWIQLFKVNLSLIYQYSTIVICVACVSLSMAKHLKVLTY